MAEDIRESKREDLDHVENAHVEYNDLGNAGLHAKVLNEEARQATAAEHSFTFVQAIKAYKRAAFWSNLISTTVIMEGYNVTLLGSFIGYPAFRHGLLDSFCFAGQGAD